MATLEQFTQAFDNGLQQALGAERQRPPEVLVFGQLAMHGYLGLAQGTLGAEHTERGFFAALASTIPEEEQIIERIFAVGGNLCVIQADGIQLYMSGSRRAGGKRIMASRRDSDGIHTVSYDGTIVTPLPYEPPHIVVPSTRRFSDRWRENPVLEG